MWQAVCHGLQSLLPRAPVPPCNLCCTCFPARLVDEALGAGVKVAVCSTSNEKAVSAIVRVMLGPDRFRQMQIFAGDVVPKKKPDPVSKPDPF